MKEVGTVGTVSSLASYQMLISNILLLCIFVQSNVIRVVTDIEQTLSTAKDA